MTEPPIEIDFFYCYYKFQRFFLALNQPSKEFFKISPENLIFFPQSDNAQSDDVHLDDEMEKVFSEPNIIKFDVRKLSDVNAPASATKLDTEQSVSPKNQKFSEQDYDCKCFSDFF